MERERNASRRKGLDGILAGLPLPTNLHRHAYRLAFGILRIWWFVRRPEVCGACVAIHDEERVLVVKVSYRAGYSLPGGGIDNNESPLEAALRELEEEVGLVPKAELLEVAGEVASKEQGRRIRTTLFSWRPDPLPNPQTDGREVVWAGYRSFTELKGTAMSPSLLWVVARAGSPGAGQGFQQRETPV